ncbi:MBL fold metallo-hydrolase, partial [Porticoccaceae bacterium]|nr:MBL fold metallo-hydrolase [Porticoccaceae bacterium]
MLSLTVLLSLSAMTLSADEGYNPEALKSGRVDPSLHLQQGSTQAQAQKINEVIYKATGFGNTFMVVTDEGNVIIDTSLPGMAPKHKSLLNVVDDGPVHSIIITHGHGDHTGGVALWREPQTKVIAQENMIEFLRYQKRLKGLFIQRNSAQFGFDLTSATSSSASESAGVNMLPNTLFDKHLNFTLGKEKFEVLHTPAETYDALTLWMPEYKAAFVGDLFYRSFPNIYTLRGTKPRWALDYIASIDRVLALGPEILLPSHGEPILGNENITVEMTRYRDAIQYVHDQTVVGMNEGRDVYSLMREIKLPAALDVGEAYGWVSWSVRGIYEGYMGWFDGDPVNMYAESPQSIYPDLVSLAGGAKQVISLAEQHLSEGDRVKALLLIEAAMAAEPNNPGVLEKRLEILTALRQASA